MSDSAVYQINVRPRTPGTRGLPKRAVEKAELRKTGVAGDFNRYRSEKLDGDPDSAVSILPRETLQELQQEGWPVQPGDLGENLTTSGILHSEFEEGDRFRIGSQVEIEITRACRPCRNLALLPYVSEARLKEFMQALLNRRGWYACVKVEGEVRPGASLHRIE